MEPQFYVLLPLEPPDADCRLVVTGCLTDANQHWLYPLIRKTRASRPHGTVVVDLTRVRALGSAVDLLRWDLEHDEATGEGATVRVLEPRPDPAPGRST